MMKIIKNTTPKNCLVNRMYMIQHQLLDEQQFLLNLNT